MHCQQPSKLSIPFARPKAGGEGLLCRHQDAAAWPQEPQPGQLLALHRSEQPCNCSDVAPVQVCTLRWCLSTLYPEAQIPIGIWKPPAETVKLKCLHAMQILAWGLYCFIHSCFTPDLGQESKMAEGVWWSLKAISVVRTQPWCLHGSCPTSLSLGEGEELLLTALGAIFLLRAPPSVSLLQAIPSGGQRSGEEHTCTSGWAATEWQPCDPNLSWPSLLMKICIFPTGCASLCYLYLSVPPFLFVSPCTRAVFVLISKPTHVPLSKLPGYGMFYASLLAPKLQWDYMMSRFPCSQT